MVPERGKEVLFDEPAGVGEGMLQFGVGCWIVMADVYRNVFRGDTAALPEGPTTATDGLLWFALHRWSDTADLYVTVFDSYRPTPLAIVGLALVGHGVVESLPKDRRALAAALRALVGGLLAITLGAVV